MNHCNLITDLSIQASWYRQHSNDKPEYYEFTMHELITTFTLENLKKIDFIGDEVRKNIERLIVDNKKFITDHIFRHN